MAGTNRFDVYAYLDYRALLRAYYDERKEQGRGFSYRAFARRAGLKSPNLLKRVIDGERNLTPEMAERFARACGLDGEAASYFRELVAFNEAKTEADRNARYRKLSAFRGYRLTRGSRTAGFIRVRPAVFWTTSERTAACA